MGEGEKAGWIRFDAVEIDLDGHRLLVEGAEVPLEPKAFAVLALLAGHPGHAFTRDEILDTVWGHTHVTPGVLNRIVTLLRHALGESADAHRYLHTVHGIGYRFDLPATRVPAPGMASAAQPNAILQYAAVAGATPVANRASSHTIRRAALWLLPLLVVLLIGLTVVLWHGQTRLPQPSRVATAPSSSGAKSIAVLPFKNLSPDPDNAYFAVGMQEQIVSQLTGLSGLTTISRISTEKYASHPKEVKDIGRELGVGNILEGSVQKAGKEARISLELIDTHTGQQVWAKTYDRNLDNVFAVESEVAAQVAKALRVRLLPNEKQQLARAPTRNPEAYEALLRGEAAQQRAEVVSWKKSDIDAAIAAFQQATTDDPKFALAWARLGYAYAWTLNYVADVDRPTMMKRSREAFGHALALNPDLPEGHIAAGFYHYWAEKDNVAAREQFKEALALNPKNAESQLALAGIEHELGHLDDSELAYRRTLSLDPRNILALMGLAWLQGDKRQYAEADRTLVRALAIDYHAWLTWCMRDLLTHKATGDGAAMLAMIRSAPPDVVANPNAVIDQAQALYYMHDYAGALKLYASGRGSIYDKLTFCIWRADAQWMAGQRSEAKARYEHCAAMFPAYPQHESDPWDPTTLGWVYARLGRTQDAERKGLLAVKQRPISKSWVEGAGMLYALARIRAQLGQADQAVSLLDSLLAADHGVVLSIAMVRSDPDLDPIRNDPAFKQLLQKYSPADAPVK